MSQLPSTVEKIALRQRFYKRFSTASPTEISKFLFTRAERLLEDSRKIKQEQGEKFTTTNPEYRRLISDAADDLRVAASFSKDKPWQATLLVRSAKIFSFLERHEESGDAYLAAAQRLREVGKERDLEMALNHCSAAIVEFETAKQGEKIELVKTEQEAIRTALGKMRSVGKNPEKKD